MERVAAWIFEQDLFWFVLDNAEFLTAIAALLWIRETLIRLSEIFSNDKPLG